MTTKSPAPQSPGRRSPGGTWVFPVVVGVIVLMLVVAVVAVVAGRSSSKQSGPGGKAATVETSAEVTVKGTSLPAYKATGTDPAVGMTAPTLGSVDFQGKSATVGGATGKPYLVAFLAHWCPHCQAEVPRIVALQKAGDTAGVDVIAVPTGTSKTYPNYPPSAWLAREGWPFRSLLDDATSTAAKAYGLAAYPHLVFVDANGKVAGRVEGEVPEGQLSAVFRALAAGKPLPLPGAGASSSA